MPLAVVRPATCQTPSPGKGCLAGRDDVHRWRQDQLGLVGLGRDTRAKRPGRRHATFFRKVPVIGLVGGPRDDAGETVLATPLRGPRREAGPVGGVEEGEDQGGGEIAHEGHHGEDEYDDRAPAPIDRSGKAMRVGTGRGRRSIGRTLAGHESSFWHLGGARIQFNMPPTTRGAVASWRAPVASYRARRNRRPLARASPLPRPS